MIRSEPITRFRAHGRASRTTCLARYRAPGLTFTQRPKEMWSLPLSSQSPPELSLKGDTLPALEDRGPS